MGLREAKNLGFVLKNYYPNKNKLDILCKYYGRKSFYVKSTKLEYKLTRVSSGTFIDYKINNSYIIDFELYSLPEINKNNFSGLKNLNFWHKLIEISYFFIPEGLLIDNFFELIYFLGINFPKLYNLENKLTQEVVICKTFVLLGFYPENYSYINKHLRELLNLPIDIILNQKIKLEWQGELSAWIQHVISNHPQVNLFKTITY